MLWNTRITDRALEGLQGLSELKFLSVAQNDITNTGLDYLTKVVSLEGVVLDQTSVTDAGLGTSSAAQPHDLAALRYGHNRCGAGTNWDVGDAERTGRQRHPRI